MIDFIVGWLAGNVRGADVRVDEAGNIYVTKGVSESYPCICAHTDQVQGYYAPDYEAVETPGIIFGWSRSERAMQGLGADDKNGIWVALRSLQRFDVLKCAFFTGEEVGCVGSSSAELDFFDDCRFCVQVDRRGGGDLITDIGGRICSDDFLDAIGYRDFGYAPAFGLMTDVEALRGRGVECSCINVSCGYYEPHTEFEYTVKSELENCKAFVWHIIESCTECYPYIEEPQVWHRGLGGDWHRGLDDDWPWSDEYNDDIEDADFPRI